MRRTPALILVSAIVLSACEILAPQTIPPPDLPTAPPSPPLSEGPEFVQIPDPTRTPRPGTTGTASPTPTATPEIAGREAARALWLLLRDPTERTRAGRDITAYLEAVPDRGPTPHSSNTVPPRAPSGETRITAQAAGWMRLEKGLSDKARKCGPGDGYIVVCPVQPDPTKFTDYYVMTMTLQAPLPQKGSPGIYTYAFVLDVDGRPENNFKPEPAFPNDFYKDTDLWYEIHKAANGDFFLEIWLNWLARGQELSGARVLIKGDTIMLVAPADELPSVPAGYRMTTFRHSGDFGQAVPPDWSGDTSPRVGEPLRAFVKFEF